jgi:hypothetical protein
MNINLEYAISANLEPSLDQFQTRLQAVRAFNQAYSRGRLGQLVSKLSGRHNQLEVLDAQPLSSTRTSRIVTVPIRQIKGTLGRSVDFDLSFNPLRESSRTRWVSVATAMKNGLPLPPVELVKTGDGYYVRDGHHRISVAKSLDQEDIEARIVN